MSESSLKFGVFLSLGACFSVLFLYATVVLILHRCTTSGGTTGVCRGPWTTRDTVHLLISLAAAS